MNVMITKNLYRKVVDAGACLLLLPLCSLLFTACFSDDSEEGTMMPDITIADLEEQYTATSFVEEFLDIQPVITTSIPEQNLEYRWVVMQNNDESGAKTPKEELIGSEKNLHYEVALSPKTYTLKLEVVDKETGFMRSKTTSLVVVTEFSKGFYILKETSDGNTDIDLFNLETGSLGSDLISSIHGAPLNGSPLNMSISYLNYYIDESDQQVKYANQLFVGTKTGDFRMFNSNDLSVTFDRENICYSDLGEDEIIYAVQHSMWNNNMLTNKGAYNNYSGAMADYGMTCSGRYGVPALDSGGSIYFFYYYMNMYYWDEANGRIYLVDYNGSARPCTDSEGLPMDLSAYRCVGGGPNALDGMSYFVLEDKTTKERQLASIFGFSDMIMMMPITPGTHMAQSDFVAFNANQGSYIYNIDGGKLYAYDTMMADERQISLQGISGDVCYVSNLYTNAMFSDGFDYLLVGQQNGDEYVLHFYNMVGGIPDGTPFATVKGTGKLKNCRYMNPQLTGNDFMYNSTLVYPWV